ncbi:MAG: penicillin acylase family protein [bacterium]|nr:penicillin acylase family protein [bacterium]
MRSRMTRLARVGGLLVLVWPLTAVSEPIKGPVRLSEAEQQAYLAHVEACLKWPDPEDLPVPPDGWYSLELGGDTIDVFRDEYGVPHVFAPSVAAAFRAQGYVTGEDRCIQVLERREAVMGRRCAAQGDRGRSHDMRIRTEGRTIDELNGLVDKLRPDQQVAIDEYIVGLNEYLRRNAPRIPPVERHEVAAGAVYFLTRIGNINDFDLQFYELTSVVRFLRGEEFMRNMLDDCLPRNVVNAPTTDHSYDRQQAQGAAPMQSAWQGDLHLDAMQAIAAFDKEADDFALKEGFYPQFGSQAWAVAPKRSANGNAMFFGCPLIGYSVPCDCSEIHLCAPGLNVRGLAYTGVPGVVIGHNERVIWSSTSGLLDQVDIFVEELNPDNHLQYKHNGEWKEMEVIESPLVMKQEDGSIALEPYRIYRTVHGPVVHWEDHSHKAFSKCNAQTGLQPQSFCAFTDLDFAKDLNDVDKALYELASAHNVLAADVDGNIGYWFTGRFPKRKPGQDGRLPVPGTGEYDWLGLIAGPDMVKSVNPPEGWFGDSNGKPGINVHGWWPEVPWGLAIREGLMNHNPIDWESFVGLHRKNAEHYMFGPYFRDYLVEIVKERNNGDPLIDQACALIENWDGANLPGTSAVLLYDEWAMETLMELLSPDFEGLVERSLSTRNLQLFGLLAFRVLQPEKSGVRLKQDYLHGRDPGEITYRCFLRVLKKLIAEHGADLEAWPYEPRIRDMKNVGKIRDHNMAGTYWMAAELSNPMRVMTMLPPGQCELPQSPHFKDQFELFYFYQLKPTRYMPEDFGR